MKTNILLLQLSNQDACFDFEYLEISIPRNSKQVLTLVVNNTGRASAIEFIDSVYL